MGKNEREGKEKVITHNLIKQNLIVIIALLYLINSYDEEKHEYFFKFLSWWFILVPFIALLINPTLSNIIERSWTYSTSFIVYYFGFISIWRILREKNMKYSYSLLLTTSLITASGWLYEIPRYYRLLGIGGLIRTNNQSLFRYDIGIPATILCMMLLYKKDYKVTWVTLSAVILYFFYLVSYYEPYLRYFRHVIGVWFYKLIIIMLMWVIVRGLEDEKKIHN